ncbi:MAG: tetratricopeptide repeat protein [Candidatus Sericytochromatia bacterium]
MSRIHVDNLCEEARLALEKGPDPQNTQAALRCYRHAITQYPEESAEPYLGMAFFAFQTGLLEEALVLLEQGLKAEPFHRVAQRLFQQIRAIRLSQVSTASAADGPIYSTLRTGAP